MRSSFVILCLAALAACTTRALTRMAVLTALSVAFYTSPIHGGQNPTVDAVLRGKKCSEDRQQWDCEYSVGRDLRFAIAGLGTPNTGIAFLRSDFDGDYYASFGMLHGCVIVQPGGKSKGASVAFAFVSPTNGKVYDDWQDCQARV